MRVLLTGANGWMGAAITRELIEAGHAVVGLVRSRDNADTASPVAMPTSIRR